MTKKIGFVLKGTTTQFILVSISTIGNFLQSISNLVSTNFEISILNTQNPNVIHLDVNWPTPVWTNVKQLKMLQFCLKTFGFGVF